MATKTYKLILGLITILATTSFAQVNTGYRVFDSSVIPSKRLPQQNEFMNNVYDFPAKPRTMLEVGASFGNIGISGDVRSKVPALGWGVHIRKSIGYVFSMIAIS
jgi:hypothetical protein